MPSYTRRIRDADVSKLRYTVKSQGGELRADQPSKKPRTGHSAKIKAMAASLTLDDFGGRSDALGG